VRPTTCVQSIIYWRADGLAVVIRGKVMREKVSVCALGVELAYSCVIVFIGGSVFLVYTSLQLECL
jgi:hypothetical protein